MPKRALVLLAEESEEMEAVTIIDILHRAGIEVEIVGIPENRTIKCSGGVTVHPTMDIQRAKSTGPFDAVILPGGLSGAKILGKHREVGNILRDQENSGRIIAAGCAAPVFVLKAHGIGEGKMFTCYPTLVDELTNDGRHYFSPDHVVVDGNITTSREPSTAVEFALSIVLQLVGTNKHNEIAKAVRPLH